MKIKNNDSIYPDNLNFYLSDTGEVEQLEFQKEKQNKEIASLKDECITALQNLSSNQHLLSQRKFIYHPGQESLENQLLAQAHSSASSQMKKNVEIVFKNIKKNQEDTDGVEKNDTITINLFTKQEVDRIKHMVEKINNDQFPTKKEIATIKNAQIVFEIARAHAIQDPEDFIKSIKIYNLSEIERFHLAQVAIKQHKLSNSADSLKEDVLSPLIHHLELKNESFVLELAGLIFSSPLYIKHSLKKTASSYNYFEEYGLKTDESKFQLLLYFFESNPEDSHCDQFKTNDSDQLFHFAKMWVAKCKNLYFIAVNRSKFSDSQMYQLIKLAVEENVKKIDQLDAYIKKFSNEQKEELLKIICQKGFTGFDLSLFDLDQLDPASLLEMAYLSAQNHPLGFRGIEQFPIQKEEDRINIATIAMEKAQKGGSNPYPNERYWFPIAELNITNREALKTLAKIGRDNPSISLAPNIKDYGDLDEEFLKEILISEAGKFPEKLIFCMKNFKINCSVNQKFIVELAKSLAEISKSDISNYIHIFRIENEDDRIAIAKIAAKNFKNHRSGWPIPFPITNYKISDKKALQDIVEIVAQNPETTLSDSIQLYNIEDLNQIERIEDIEINKSKKHFDPNYIDPDLVINVFKLSSQSKNYLLRLATACVNYKAKTPVEAIKTLKIYFPNLSLENSLFEYLENANFPLVKPFKEHFLAIQNATAFDKKIEHFEELQQKLLHCILYVHAVGSEFSEAQLSDCVLILAEASDNLASANICYNQIFNLFDKGYQKLNDNKKDAINWVLKLPDIDERTKSDIIQRIKSPHMISQSNYNVCGPASFCIILADRYPQIYAQAVHDLITKGVTLHPFKIKRDRLLKDSIDIDKILLNSLRSTKNALLSVTSGTGIMSKMSGASLPQEIISWLDAISVKKGGANATKARNLTILKGINPVIKAAFKIKNPDMTFRNVKENLEACLQSFNESGKRPEIIMLMDVNLAINLCNNIEQTESSKLLGAEFPHYVVLNHLDLENGSVKISISTWGKKTEIVTIDERKFLKGYRGCIIADLPETLS